MKIIKILICAVLLFSLISCSDTIVDAKKRMEENGYILLDPTGLYNPKGDYGEFEVYYYAYGETKEEAVINLVNGGDWLIAIYFKDNATATSAYEEFKNGNIEERTAKIDNRCIYYGTTNAIEIFE